MAKCPVAVAFTSEGNTTLIFCGTWGCPHCSRFNAGRWAKRVELGIRELTQEGEKEAWLLTLTLGSAYSDIHAGFLALPKLWDSTRKAYQRYYSTFTYAAFIEGQPKRGGMPHFHIVSTVEPPTKRGRGGFVTKHGVHDFAVAFGWGYQAELSLIDGPEAAVYVSKYTSKGSPSMPKSFRRVRVSRDFPKLPELDGLPLLVPSREEDMAHFIDRVQSLTGVPHEDLYQRWQEGRRHLFAVQRGEENADRSTGSRAAHGG